MMFTTILSLAFVSTTAAFTLTDCNNSPNKVLRVSNIRISSDPVHIPGPETFSGDLEILRPISGNHFRLDVVIEKHVLFGYPDMPCLTAAGQKVGSCSYNLCDLLSMFKDANGTSHCPLQLEQDHFPCACPFQPGHYRLNHATFQIPEVSGIYSFLAGALVFDLAQLTCQKRFDCRNAILGSSAILLDNSPNKVLRVSNIRISSDPVHIPGPETFSGDLEILRPISGNHFRLDVVIEKHVLFGYPDMPCLTAAGQKVGSCSYNLCDLLSMFKDANGTSHCPLQLEQDHFPCACPFQPGHYRLNHATFQIPEVSGIYSFLAGGDYKIHVKLVDTNTGEQVGCYNLKATIDSGCTGFFCSIIGK